MTDKDAVEILMNLIRCGRVSTWTTNEDAYRMVLQLFSIGYQCGWNDYKSIIDEKKE